MHGASAGLEFAAARRNGGFLGFIINCVLPICAVLALIEAIVLVNLIVYVCFKDELADWRRDDREKRRYDHDG